MDWYDSLYRLRELAPRWGLRKGDRAAYNWKGEGKTAAVVWYQQGETNICGVTLSTHGRNLHIKMPSKSSNLFIVVISFFLAFSPNYPLDGTVDLAPQASKPPGGILPSEPGIQEIWQNTFSAGSFLLTWWGWARLSLVRVNNIYIYFSQVNSSFVHMRVYW